MPVTLFILKRLKRPRGRYTMMEFIFWFLLLFLSLSPNLTITHDQFVALPDMSGNALFCKLFW